MFSKIIDIYCKTDARNMRLISIDFVLIAAGCVGLDTCISRGIQRDTDTSEQQRRFPADE